MESRVIMLIGCRDLNRRICGRLGKTKVDSTIDEQLRIVHQEASCPMEVSYQAIVPQQQAALLLSENR
jgi:hypothetical protein